MNTSGIVAAPAAQDLARVKAFYIEKVGFRAAESRFLEASDGRVGLTVGDGVNRLFVYPARTRSSGEFTQAVIQVGDVPAAVEEMGGRGVEFEECGTPETSDREWHCSDAGWSARERGSRTRKATWSASFAPRSASQR
jgi:hypothetical protein